jgi:adenylate cyclase
MSCGAGLSASCPTCGTENPPGAKFCIECGTALGGAAPATPAAAPTEAPPEERRQATILFADLSGYTAAAERMDPEAVKALVGSTLRRLGEEIERFGGSIDKFIGDNVMGVFGAPTAHEDDPERAVRAGLAMQAAMEGANRESKEKYGVEFSLRVGINSGEVMAGAVGDRYTVMGDAVNVAARLQDLTKELGVPILLSAETARLAGDTGRFADVGDVDVRGKARPVRVVRLSEV